MSIKTILRSLRKHQIAASAGLTELAKSHEVEAELTLALDPAMPEAIAEAAMDVVEKAISVKEEALDEVVVESAESTEEAEKEPVTEEAKPDTEEPKEETAAEEPKEEAAQEPTEEVKSFKSFDEVLTKSGIKHAYDAAADSFNMRFDAQITGSFGNFNYEDVVKAAGFKNSGDDFTPSDSEFEKIIALTPRKNYTKDDFKVYKTVSAGTAVDSHYEQFTPKALGTMAKTANGMPFIKDHVYKADNVLGVIFDGQVANLDDGNKYLVQKVAVRNKPENKDLMDGLESFNNRLSVGIKIKRKDYICNVCNKEMYKDPNDCKDWSEIWCGHQAGSETKVNGVKTLVTATLADATQHELSNVALGAQPCAAIKSAEGSTELEDNNEQNHTPLTLKAIESVVEAVKNGGVFTVDEFRKEIGLPALEDKERGGATVVLSKEEAEVAPKADLVEPAQPGEVDKVDGEAETLADQVTSPAEVTTDADKTETPTLQPSKFGVAEVDELKAMIAAQAESNDLLKQLVAAVSTNNEKKSEEVEAYKAGIVEYKAATEARETLFKKQLAETRQLAELSQAQLKEFISTSNKLLGKSHDEVVQGILNSHLKEKTLTEEDKAKRDREGTDFYKSLTERIVGQ